MMSRKIEVNRSNCITLQYSLKKEKRGDSKKNGDSYFTPLRPSKNIDSNTNDTLRKTNIKDKGGYIVLNKRRDE